MSNEPKTRFFAGQQIVLFSVFLSAILLQYLSHNRLTGHSNTIIFSALFALDILVELLYPIAVVTAESLSLRRYGFRRKVISWSEVTTVEKKKSSLIGSLEVTLADGSKVKIQTVMMFDSSKEKLFKEIEKRQMTAMLD